MDVIGGGANQILAQTKLGVKATVNLKTIALEILKQELENKRLLCKIV